MTFWKALWESILDAVIGRNQIEAWRAEKKQREACERAFRQHMAEAAAPVSRARLEFHPLDGSQAIMTVSDGRGVFTFEQWQSMPPEIPPPLKPLWRE